MTSFRLIAENLRHFWRTNLAVVLGVAAATAVIGGALIVGDSVRDSLRQMSLDRLGGVDYALSGQRYFRQQLAEELAADSKAGIVAPAISLTGSLTRSSESETHRAGGIAVLGADEHFWSLMRAPSLTPPTDHQVVVNRRLADAVGAEVGDAVSLVVEIPASIPRDSLLGDRSETVTELTLTVSGIAEDETTPGRFGLNPAQQLPMNAFVSLDTLQQQVGLQHQPASRRNPIEKPARINTLFVGRDTNSTPTNDAANDADPSSLNQELSKNVTLQDLGLRIVTNEEHGYLSLESEQLILEDAAAKAGMTVGVEMKLAVSPVVVYLLNEVWDPSDAEKFSMYAVAAGIDFTNSPPFGPLEYVEGGPPGGEDVNGAIPVVINEWLADDLGVHAGDTIASKYHQVGDRGELPELEQRFHIAGIAHSSGPAADPGITPYVEGITDAENFSDWRQPFPMKLDRVTARDEEFWDEHKTTPKVFLPRDAAEKLWRSRYGTLTSVRVAPTDSTSLEDVADEFVRRLLERATRTSGAGAAGTIASSSFTPFSGLVFRPVKLEGIQAARGTTDFTGLFLGFSFFLIAAAMLLIGLLFRLGIERRVSELGLLAAVGLSPRRVKRLFLAEGALLTLIGGLIGCLAAVGYAALMIYGLKTWWFGAIGTRFLYLSVRPASVALGFVIAAIVAWAAIWWSFRGIKDISTRALLAGVRESALNEAGRRARGRKAGIVTGIAAALAVSLLAATLTGAVPQSEAFSGFNWRTVVFFVIGIATMVGSLAGLASWLDADRAGAVRGHGLTGVIRLGLRNAARHRGRSLLTASLIASATFVIVAVAAGKRNPAAETPIKASGNGGFMLVAESSVPVLYDLNTDEGRAKAGMDSSSNDAARRVLDGMRVMSFRVKPGENASCLNIYQTQLPTILGVPLDVLETFIEEARFKFADTPSERPWELLNKPLADGRIPVLGDMNTLMYSLHKGIGDLIHVPPGEHPGGTLQIEGMLDGSVFQGVLLMSEKNFFRLFPDQSGFRYFLIEANPSEAEALSTILETQLADYGFDAQRVADRLADFLAVQNTYLSTFQTLGGLGLLLGTLGLATVMLRNVLERRGELALLQAVGFHQFHIIGLVLCENAFLLLWGLASGTLAALLAMTPHLVSTGADVPWGGLQALLIGVFVVGILAALLAVREAVRTPILATLRAE